MPRLSNLYLFTYNFAQTIGWAVALIQILIGFSSTKSFNGAFASSGQIICLLQKAAFLEVIHGALGIVPSGVLLPLMQWGGRSHYLLAIAGKIVELQTSPSIFITFVAWSISEIIRYSNYALSCIGDCPYWSIYVRYTVFIPLYPVGVAGEMWLMYQALTYIKEKDLYKDFFSVLPFSYHTFVQVVLLCYPLLWMKLYLHLLKQRRSKLRKHHEKKRE
ncbi:very-long-chain (3R)-3-hydroxyacyl-CoA dehydratase 2-like isoform X1 [Chenopodium quinoa]|uniref:very-long-chain (3R)-3-hydroxyacyl-CoA dehydratase 2-like isoform X1 n=1 Tax=Chenopodium quinoa TaxID=63459 RepID=UPI000B76CE38|nr:very-long-chain (3R)-3-hydroxyacyl-CoA dehydratase 2-like isoform X1 [Chenopodium quinoa]